METGHPRKYTWGMFLGVSHAPFQFSRQKTWIPYLSRYGLTFRGQIQHSNTRGGGTTSLTMLLVLKSTVAFCSGSFCPWHFVRTPLPICYQTGFGRSIRQIGYNHIGYERYRPQTSSATTYGHTQCRYRPQVNKH